MGGWMGRWIDNWEDEWMDKKKRKPINAKLKIYSCGNNLLSSCKVSHFIEEFISKILEESDNFNLVLTFVRNL